MKNVPVWGTTGLHRLVVQCFLLVSCLGMGVFLSGCDAAIAGSSEEAAQSLSALDLIESMEMSPLPNEHGGEIREYVLRVKLKDAEGIDYPESINLLGASSMMPSSLPRSIWERQNP